jgi:hypothetical protein
MGPAGALADRWRIVPHLAQEENEVVSVTDQSDMTSDGSAAKPPKCRAILPL